MPSIALPTAEKQDEILKIVSNYTGNKNIVPVFREEFDVYKETYIDPITPDFSSLAVLLEDTQSGRLICNSQNKSIVILDSTTFNVLRVIDINTINILYSFYYGGFSYAFDGTNLFCSVYSGSSSLYYFAYVNIDTGVITLKGSFVSTSNSFLRTWTVDRETGYLYMSNTQTGEFYLFKDPLNVWQVGTDPSIIKITLNQCVPHITHIIGNYAYIYGINNSSTSPASVYKLDKRTLSVIGSKVVNGLYTRENVTSKLSNDGNTLLIFGSTRIFKIDVNSLDFVDLIKNRSYLNGDIITAYDGDSTIAIINMNSSINDRYLLDIKSGFIIDKTSFKSGINISAGRLLDYDIENDTLYSIVKNSIDQWNITEFRKVYIIDHYVQAEGEII